jgi:hypothetical protein
MIFLGNLDKPEKYDSMEFAAMGVDEYVKNKIKSTGETVFSELRKRLRWPSVPGQPGFPPEFVFPIAIATNPGGPSHAEVKKLWIDRDFPQELKEYADAFKYIKALSSDNPYNPPDYYKWLLTLPPKMARAYAEGDWNVFSGQFFSEWYEPVHVVSEAEQQQLFGGIGPEFIPKHWKRFTAGDWGRTQPSWNGWFAVSPEGDVYLYRESFGNDKDPQEWGKIWLNLSRGENIAYRIFDPAVRNVTPTGQSIQMMFSEVGWDVLLGNNDRANGWVQMHRYMTWKSDKDGNVSQMPKFRIFSQCKYAIRTVPAMQHDEHKPEDLDTNGEDHACDGIRYGLMSCPAPAPVNLDSLDPRWRDAMLRVQHQKSPK